MTQASMTQSSVTQSSVAPPVAFPLVSGLAAAAQATPVALIAALPGLIYVAGFDHLAYGIGLLAGIMLGGVWVAPKLAASGAASATEALAMRFGVTVARLAAIVVVLVVLSLLVAEFALVGAMAKALEVPGSSAIVAALALALLGALLLGDRLFRAVAAIAFALLSASLLIPLALLATKFHGAGFPLIDYGRTFSEIGALEEKLLGAGLVDFDTFSGHVSAFLKLTPLDMIALVITLALGVAVFPPLLASVASARKPAAARLAGAWTTLLVMVVLLSAPALAAYAKLEIYGALTSSTPLSKLPPWLEAPMHAGLTRIHGTSVDLLESAAFAVWTGADTASSVSGLLLNEAARTQWAALDPETREVVFGAARTLATEPGASACDLYQSVVIPAAARAQGNADLTLSQAALAIEPAGLMLALPEMTGAPRLVLPVILLGIGSAALVMVMTLMRTLLSLRATVVARLEGPSWRRIALVVIASAVSAIAAAISTIDKELLTTAVVGSLSLAAAGLFPAVAIGLSWRRATAFGAAAAIAAGAGLALYYEAGTKAFPAAFYETWPAFSNASEPAIEEYNALTEVWREAEQGDAKDAAGTALDDWARGTATRPGLANWRGIDGAVSAIFAVPVGIVVLIVVSLLTPRRRQALPS